MLTSSGEVHGVLGVIVDLNGLGQRLGVPAVTLARHVAAFSTAKQIETGLPLSERGQRDEKNGELCVGW